MTSEEQIKKGFGKRLRERRIAKGLSQPQLSHIVEMNVGWISQIERGAVNPSLVIIVKLAWALDCQPGDLLNDL